MTDTEKFKVSKGQLKKLAEAIDGTDLMEVTLTPVTVEGKRGILARWSEDDRSETYVRKALVIGDGVVKL